MKLISSDKIDIREAIKSLNEEDRVGGFMKMLEREKQEGFDEGVDEGIEKGVELIVKKMLKNGSNIKEIILLTELPEERIKKIEEEIKH